jgi:hypothetical protein
MHSQMLDELLQDFVAGSETLRGASSKNEINLLINRQIPYRPK